MCRIFVSHADEDNKVIDDFDNIFREFGIDTWIDHRNILTGSKWQDEIDKALANHPCCVFFLSYKSAVSNGCRKEWEYCIQQNKHLLIVLMEDLRPDAIPDKLKPYHYLKMTPDVMTSENRFTLMARLISEIRKMC